jgi:hypothetical protein
MKTNHICMVIVRIVNNIGTRFAYDVFADVFAEIHFYNFKRIYK